MSSKPKPRTAQPLQQEKNHHWDSNSDESYLYPVNNASKHNANVKVTVNSVFFTTMVDTGASINVIIIYQSSKLSFPCVLLVESVSREIDEIKLSPSHQRERETMHYSPVNNEKKSRAPSREHATFGPLKTANVFLNSN